MVVDERLQVLRRRSGIGCDAPVKNDRRSSDAVSHSGTVAVFDTSKISRSKIYGNAAGVGLKTAEGIAVTRTTGRQPPLGRRHLPGLDGLRAIAVIGVLLYHAGVGWIPGGFLGVDLFFVISGFLITSLLLAESDLTGRISLRHFYLRRARRLLPALAAMLAGRRCLHGDLLPRRPRTGTR